MAKHGAFGYRLLSLSVSPILQCHRIHRSLASQFKYALVWVSLWAGDVWGSCPASPLGQAGARRSCCSVQCPSLGVRAHPCWPLLFWDLELVRPLGTLSCLRAVWQCRGPHIRLWHSHPPQNIYTHTHLPLVIAIPGLALLRTEADVAPLSPARAPAPSTARSGWA